MNLLLIDNRVSNVELVSNASLPNVTPIIVDYWQDTFETLLAKIPAQPFDSIGIFQENYFQPTYQFLNATTPAQLDDPDFTSWTPLLDFFTQVREKTSLTKIDMMGCNIGADANWTRILDHIQTSLGVQVASSTDPTGSASLGGNWILETSNTNLVGKYFTESIRSYEFVLGPTSTHALLLTASGEVYVAGSNTSGCSGLGSNYTTYPTVTEFMRLPVSDISAVSYGSSNSFLLTRNRDVLCCGANANGQLGLGNTTAQTDLSFVRTGASTRLTNVAAVAAGNSHAVFVLTDGSALACGLNTSGQLGDITSNTQKSYPSQVLSAAATPLPKVISSVGAGAQHTVLGATDGTAWACGSNMKGQIGAGTITAQVDAFDYVTKALWLSNDTNYMTMDAQNRVSQWSDRSGNGRHATQTTDANKPVYNATTKSVNFNGTSQGFDINLDFLVNKSHMAFILTKTTGFGLIYGAKNGGTGVPYIGFQDSTKYNVGVWGSSNYVPSITSNFSSGNFNLITYKLLFNNITNIYANTAEEFSNNGLMITQMYGGGVLGLNVAGLNRYYGGSITEIIFLIDGDITTNNIASVNNYMMKKINDNYRTVTVPAGSTINAPMPNTSYTLQVKTNETTNLSGVSRVVAGGNHSLALTSAGNVYSWGENTSGQLGRNNNTDASFANLVLTSGGATLTNISQVAAGQSHSLFLTTTGTVFACGLNTSGQLGNNTTTSSNQLVSVLNPAGTAALSSITKITAIANTSFFLASDGTLYACGSNAQSQMGFVNSGATTYYTLPVQLSLVDFAKAKAAGYSSRNNRLLGYEAWQQRYYGESSFSIASAGYSSADLSNSGLTSTALKTAGLTSTQTAFLGFSDEQAYPPSPISSTASLAASASLFTKRENGNFVQAVTSSIHDTKFYDMSASSHFLSGDSVDLPPSAFSNTQVWRSEALWNTTTGAYTGSATTTMSGTSYSGEWIQIQLPSAIRLSSYSFVPSVNRTPLVFYLGGSVDGTTWTLLDSRNTSTTGGSVNRFTPTVGGVFNYYRLVVNAVQTSNDGFLALNQLKLNTASIASRSAMSATDLSLVGHSALEIIAAGKPISSLTSMGVALPANNGLTVKQLRGAGYNYGDIVRNSSLKLIKVGQPSLTASNIGTLMAGAILDPPSGFSATDRDASSISVAIGAPIFSTGLTGYSVQAVPVTGGSTVSKSLATNGTLVDGLAAGKIYDIAIRSVNANGNSQARVLRNSTSLSALPALNEGTITASSIVVNFAALPTTQDCSYVLRTTPASNQYVLANGATTQTLSGLTQTTTYSIILEASNAFVTAVPVTRSSTTISPYTGAQYYFSLNGTTANTGSDTNTLTLVDSSASPFTPTYAQVGGKTTPALFCATNCTFYTTNSFTLANAANAVGSISYFVYPTAYKASAGIQPLTYIHINSGGFVGYRGLLPEFSSNSNGGINGNILFMFGGQGGGEPSTSYISFAPTGNEFAVNNWTHVAMTWNVNSDRTQATATVYVNGSSKGTMINYNIATYGDRTPNAYENKLSASYPSTSSMATASNKNAYYANLAVWNNKQLTQTEVNQLISSFK